MIIGGLGSLWGTLAGSMVLGVAQAIGFRVDPGWGILFGHVAFLAILAVRPQGLFPARGTRDLPRRRHETATERAALALWPPSG